MNKIIKVGKIPGKLVQVTLDSNISYTAREVFNLAEIDIDDNYTINDGSSKIGLNDTVHGSILVASAKIKGNSGKMVKVGKIPGKLVQVCLDENTNYTAREVFDLANIEIDDNYTINDGSSKIGLNDTVHGSILVASAKIKGNSNKMVKVGKIPGKLVQVVLDDNTNYTAREVFDLANIDIDDNYTINDGSSKIGLNDTVHGTILVASAKIKGNSALYAVYANDPEEACEEFDFTVDMLDGTFTVVSNFDETVILKDVYTNETYIIDQYIFDKYFVVCNENKNSNCQTKNSTIYVLKEYINSDEIFEIPSDMIDGQFNLILDMGCEVSLENIDTNETYVIRKSLFENLFEVYNEENINSNNQIDNCTTTQPTSNLNCSDKDVLKKFIELQINYLEQEVRDYNSIISNKVKQMGRLENLLSEFNK